jgi:serine/threonine protein kinase
MTPEEWASVKDVFEEALGRAESERAAFVRAKAGGDAAVAREVLSLLEAHAAAGEFLGSPTATRADPDAPGPPLPKRVGPYEVLREVESGGMGTVYLAEQVGPGFRRPVAVKVIRHGFSSALFVRRFQNERRILAGLSHPNIAALLDGGTTEDGLPYFAMEYVAGTPLTEYCDARRSSTAQRLILFRTICGAVQYAHQNLVVHRDLKPGNILVTQEGVPKLLDFGLAKVLEPGPDAPPEETATNLRIFTPAYASPEQVKGETVTTASDVYSLGALLYVLLTGKRPYRVTTRATDELARAVLEQDPTRPSLAVRAGAEPADHDGEAAPTAVRTAALREGTPERLSRALAGDLDTIVLKAMHKDPRRRYASAERLSADIGRHLEGRPVSARADSVGYRTRKFVMRHRVVVGASALVAASLIGGLGVSLRATKKAKEKEQLAQKRFDEVRKLANAYLFEFHDAIKNLAGSTPARDLIVKRALGYLDSLAKEAGDDPGLLRELAEAYQRMGDIQGASGRSNLGNTAGALASYRAALSIREALAAPPRGSVVDQQALGALLIELSNVELSTGQSEAARRTGTRAVEIFEALLTEAPRDPALQIMLGSAFHILADTFASTGDLKRGLALTEKECALFESALASEPEKLARRRNVAACEFLRGSLLRETGDAEAGLVSLKKAAQLLEALATADPTNGRIRRDIASNRSEIGHAFRDLGNLTEAIESYRSSLALLKELIAADPQDANVSYHHAKAAAGLSEALWNAGYRKEGVAVLEPARARLEELSRADSKNAEVALLLEDVLKLIRTESAVPRTRPSARLSRASPPRSGPPR